VPGSAVRTLPGTLAPFPFSPARSINASASAEPAEAEPGDSPVEPDPARSAADGVSDKPRARSLSGEIRVPLRRAPSIRPPMPAPEPDDTEPLEEDDEPLIVIEQGAILDEDSNPRPRKMPRRRIVRTDPPELYARAGEVDLKADADRAIDADEPRIVIDQDALATAPSRRRTAIDVHDDGDEDPSGAVIHDRLVDAESGPILLDRPRGTPEYLTSGSGSLRRRPDPDEDDDNEDTGQTNILMLAAKKPKPRSERRTQLGIPAPATGRPRHDTEASGVPTMVGHRGTEPSGRALDGPTAIDVRPAQGDNDGPDDLAPPPSPIHEQDTNRYAGARSPAQRTRPTRPAVLVDDDHPDATDDADDESHGPPTNVVRLAELQVSIAPRTGDSQGYASRHRIDYDAVDDGWGPPGTTIPPPLLGAIPGSEDDDESHAIPMPSVDSSPLMVGPPGMPSATDPNGRALARALEDATTRAIDVIRQLEHAQSRDQVVDIMINHLTETHQRAGFFVTRHATSKATTELGLFAMSPKPSVTPFATLVLDRPSTLHDVVGTRLPYRGPMHDDASRTFLIAVLGACPPEILLVPVAVRERVVGVLFGEHRQRHTFDDQLALAARAAGMALERILKSKRG
jgi:hypothetical protein